MQKIKLKEAREKSGLSQEELAERSQVSRTTISLLENGKETTVKLRTLQRLAVVLNIALSDFF
ncbi:helix-turn-helix transcriptional regulator [Streptococcus sp. H31]|uniref:helix-turn-helix transcriptional regulator n=1 Tax=Streptococcus huangxiaojuni TaxID=3237239 RepID=UPI0034A1A527